MQAPVHGLQAFVDEVAFKKLIKGGECRCLIGGIHGQVRLFPLPKDAQPLIYLDLDRQPVAVPARDVGRVKAGHRL